MVVSSHPVLKVQGNVAHKDCFVVNHVVVAMVFWLRVLAVRESDAGYNMWHVYICQPAWLVIGSYEKYLSHTTENLTLLECQCC